MVKSRNSMGSEIYDDAATFGRFNAIIGLIISSIVGLIIIGFGIYFLSTTRKRQTMVSGIVLEENEIIPCITSSNSSQKCKKETTEAKIEYEVDNETYVRPIPTQNKLYNTGQDVQLLVDKEEPHDPIIKPALSRNAIAGILIGIGVVFIIFTIISTYIVFRFKFAAGAYGVGGAINMIS